MMKQVRISNEIAEAVISELGAEIKSLKKNGREIIWEGDPSVWEGQAPFLFPICGGLRDNRYILNNREYHLEKHGFASKMQFDIESQCENAVTFLLKDTPETLECFPNTFECRVTYRIIETGLAITYDVKNTDIKTMYFSMGASTYQNFRKDIATGAPIGGWIAQGDSHDGACWSRGQAWAMYGLPLSYNYTGDATLLETCKAVSNYFLNRLQSDLVPNWDFYYKTDEDQRDTSASAVAACGLLELARNLPVTDPDREVYEAAAKTLIYALIKNYLYCDGESPNAILKSGVYAMRTNLCVDEPVIWGDYFFMEALQRLTHYYRSFW